MKEETRASAEQRERALRRYHELVRSARGDPLLEPGTRVGDFEVEGLHALGGMGEIYRARQLSLGGRRVALKILPAHRNTALDVARFEREALVLSELHNAHLAEVYGFGREGDMRFLAMRFVQGDSLGRILEEGSVPLSEALRWVEEIAAALATVHAEGLVHRDVKPANVMIEGKASPDGQHREDQPRGAVLVDFGLARRVDSWTHTTAGLAPATAAYAAPEQLIGADVDARADVFALGALLHDVLSGCDPRERDPAATGLPALPDRPDIDRDLRAIVGCATAIDRRERYANAQALLADLVARRTGQAIRARRRSASSRLWLVLKRNRHALFRWSARTSAIVAVSLLATWSWLLVQRGDELRVAFDAGNLPRVRSLAAGIPAASDPLVVRDAPLAELARRLRSNEAGDPVVRMTDRLAVDDLDGALLALAGHVQAVGLTADPVLLEILLKYLQRSSGDERGRLLQLLAMAGTTSHLDAKGDRRAALLTRQIGEILEEASAGSAAHLNALSILSTIGTTPEARVIAERMQVQDPWSEEFRLGCEVLERMLRRLTGTPQRAELLAQVDWDSLLRRIRDARDADDVHSWGNAAAFQRLAVQVHMARRACGVPTDAGLALPAAWLVSEPPRWSSLWHNATALELAAVGDVRAVGVFETFFPTHVHEWQARVVGTIAALLEDSGVIEGAISHMQSPAWTVEEIRASCRLAYDQQRAQIETGSSVADELPDGGNVPRSLEHIETLELACEPFLAGASSVAYAGLRGGPTLKIDGEALSATGRGTAPYREGSDPHALLFRHIGTSHLRVQIDHVAPTKPRWTVNVFGQNSNRRYLPHQGTVRLELYLDGRFVGTQSGVGSRRQFFRFDVPPAWLTAGRHELEIRLAPQSTTSFRMLEVTLKATD